MKLYHHVRRHIDRVKGQPHHVRKRVAFGSAAGVTAVIALVWLTGSLASGTFALPQTSFADVSAGRPVVGDSTGTPIGLPGQGVAGAAAAVSGRATPAHIEIVDVASSSTKASQPEPTTIPF